VFDFRRVINDGQHWLLKRAGRQLIAVVAPEMDK
jgi:hypothetical protein